MKFYCVEFLFLLVTTLLVDKTEGNFYDFPGTTTSPGPTVQTTQGPIQGKSNCINGAKVVSFLGVPYAKPPVGELRFQLPQKMNPWTEILVTDSTQNACPQTITPILGFEAFTVNSTSEDCLYLNVFLPSNLNSKAKLPVMVWLHGGGFTVGSATLEAYDGRYLAMQSQVIIVTVNYRLGFLGFMRKGDIKGNMGLLDQKAALEWVQNNIANFGGDPKQVTLFGQSAGAASVSLHLASFDSARLFDKAIMQSGSFLSLWSFVDVNTAEERSTLVSQKLGCMSTVSTEIIKCLRNKTVDEILSMQVLIKRLSDWWFVPTIDGTFIYRDPSEMLDAVRGKKPLLFGSTENEGSLFTSFFLNNYLIYQNLNDTEEIKTLSALFSYYPYYSKKAETKLQKILAKYPPSGSDNTTINFQTITNALSDSWFVCPTDDFASMYVCYNSYNYLFTQTLPQKLPSFFGATHGLDLVFSWSSIIKYGQLGNFTEKDIELSKQIISFWSNFAKTANPNGNSSAKNYLSWPVYTQDDHKYLKLDEEFLNGGQAEVEGSFRSEYCSFWNDLKSSKS